MKRLLVLALLLSAVLVTAIVIKLRLQRAELAGPPGGSGVIEGTRVNVAAQISARVERVSVQRGQSVKRGQPLVILDCSEVNAAIAEAEARLAMAEAQAAGARASKDAAKRGTGAAWAQAAAARARGDAIDTRRAVAERTVERLVKAGEGATPANLDQARAEASSLALERQAAQETALASAAQASVAASQGTAAQASEHAAVAAVDAARAALERARLQRRECELTAPRDAVVEELFVEAGEVAGRGAALLRLVDLDEVKIIFYLPNAEIGAVSQASAASVSADAYPGESFPGRVASISTEAAFTPRNIQTRSDRDRLVYPVEVAVENRQHRLRPGMPAEVRLAQ